MSSPTTPLAMHHYRRNIDSRVHERCPECTPAKRADTAAALCHTCFGTGLVGGYTYVDKILFESEETMRNLADDKLPGEWFVEQGHVQYYHHMVPGDVLVDKEGTRWTVTSMSSMLLEMQWKVDLRTLQAYEPSALFPLTHEGV